MDTISFFTSLYQAVRHMRLPTLGSVQTRLSEPCRKVGLSGGQVSIDSQTDVPEALFVEMLAYADRRRIDGGQHRLLRPARRGERTGHTRYPVASKAVLLLNHPDAGESHADSVQKPAASRIFSKKGLINIAAIPSKQANRQEDTWIATEALHTIKPAEPPTHTMVCV
eukprot:CAMPEP_0194489396 /NCGR_PEP_ID=MMETSP0253-20130528/8953_1 /TAXON_ID=2966 /ORGANISM="Noctiluca scintillans" /LENGTH=167 /DNA_ID=CAMNT_0039329851 /DNA_START=50 /DNA_END=553 /DNA_ORIENTATION=-